MYIYIYIYTAQRLHPRRPSQALGNRKAADGLTRRYTIAPQHPCCMPHTIQHWQRQSHVKANMYHATMCKYVIDISSFLSLCLWARAG